MSYVIFDLDGTLANGNHRMHLLPCKEETHINRAWDDFNLACDKDEPIIQNIELLNALKQQFEVLIVTGRSEIARKKTQEWLYKNGVTIDKNRLIMRPLEDNRVDVEFKEEVLSGLINSGKSILCCFDDLEHVVKHIRGMGITCHQVTHYDDATIAEKDHRSNS